ncbi:MAG: Gfo/Idh/MocA family oxidoreductase [Spirochaetes bacterium]|nr:Gfo/Idh/MocA family oxidoreductase [Spirochaetota bacterium]
MLKLGIVGCGYWGPNLIRNFNALKEVEIKTICDKDTERLDHMKELYQHVNVTTDFSDIINDSEIDAVAIATPVYTHHKLAKQCLEAGKHTFIEKPMANSVTECDELIKIANEKSLILNVGHVYLFNGAIKKIKELIDAGEIGEIYYINMRRLNLGLFQVDINVAWDLAPHDISIISYLLNERPVSVNCQGKAHINPNIEDVTNISLNYASGRFATIQSSWLDPRKIREVTIVGSKKMIAYDDTKAIEQIKVYDKRVSVPPHYDTFAEFQYSYHYGDIQIPYVKLKEPLRAECQDFINCIQSGKKSIVSGENGKAVIEILEASSKSLKENGAEIKIS